MYTSTIYISLNLRYSITFMKIEKVLNFVNKKLTGVVLLNVQYKKCSQKEQNNKRKKLVSIRTWSTRNNSYIHIIISKKRVRIFNLFTNEANWSFIVFTKILSIFCGFSQLLWGFCFCSEVFEQTVYLFYQKVIEWGNRFKFSYLDLFFK